MKQTVFEDVRQRAKLVLRVKTRSSEYLIGIHESNGRRFAIVRGVPGSDREHAVSRDSDPRVGGHSMFELPLPAWPGKLLEVATMTTSPIVSAVVDADPRSIAAVAIDAAAPPPANARSPWARPTPPNPAPAPAEVVPPGGSHGGKAWSAPAPGMLPENPRIVPQASKGTHPAMVAAEYAAGWKQGGAPTIVDVPAPPANVSPIPKPIVAQDRAGAEPQPPYPQRHVGYAESAAALLRSIAKRDRLYEDVAHDHELRERLRRSLDDCAALLEQIRRRDRT